MYPNAELTRLAAHKTVLRARIGAHREECAAALVVVLRPLAWLDRAMAAWRKISPLAKVAAIPLVLLLKRTFFRRAKIIGPLVRWGPLAFKVFRSASAARR